MPAVKRITQFKFGKYQPSRAVAIVILILVVFLVLGFFFTTGLPPVLRDLSNFSSELPERIPEIVAKIHKLPFADKLNIDSIAQRGLVSLDSTASYLFTALPNWLSHIVDIVTAAFLCIYFMLEGEHAYRFFLSLFPDPKRKRLDLTLRRVNARSANGSSAR